MSRNCEVREMRIAETEFSSLEMGLIRSNGSLKSDVIRKSVMRRSERGGWKRVNRHLAGRLLYARWDLCGGRWATAVPTATMTQPIDQWLVILLTSNRCTNR